MNKLNDWWQYDTFKLIVAVLLAALVIFLTLGFDAGRPPPQETTYAPSTTNTHTPTPTLTITPPTPGTITPTATSTNTPTPTATPTITLPPTVTPTLDICSLSLESRLSVGQTSRVTTNLNLRAAPGLDQQILLVHRSGVLLEIIGGPICTPYQEGAYMWWQVQNQEGAAGWSAEGSWYRPFYFQDPVE